MNYPLVSVLTPAYNRVRYIKQAVDSVLGQTYPNIEYIVVDDGSTDGTYEILKEMEYEKKIKLLNHPERANKGQSACLNLALRHANGKYVAILDSDDLFCNDKLMTQVEFLEAHPDVGLVYGQGYAINEKGDMLYPIPDDKHMEYGDPNRVLIDCYFALPGGSLVRKNLFDKVGKYEESLRSAEDHDMLLRLIENAKFEYIPNIAFLYRKHADAITKRDVSEMWKNGFTVVERALDRYPYSKSTIRHRHAVLYYRVGRDQLARGHYFRGMINLSLSGLLNPTRALRVILRIENVT